MGMQLAWLIPLLCAAAFLTIVLVGPYLPGKGSFIAIGAIGAGFFLFWPIMADMVRSGPASFALEWFTAGNISMMIGVTVDQLTVVMLGLVITVSLAVQVYSLGYMKDDPRFGWYFAAHSLFAAAMISLVLVDNLLVLYVAWELVGLCSYLLIGFWYEKRSAAEAAKKAFITTRIGDVALLIGVLILFKAAGTFQISTIFTMIEGGELSATTLNLSAVLLFIGAAGKSAQFPFHVWLPDAMEGPTPVSALIHAATMVAAGVYLVARMFPLFEAAPGALVLISVIGLTTAMIGAALAMVQNDIKKVLAYSTISQLGFMMLALGSYGYTAAIFHLVAHGFFKALLFLGAGSVIHGLHGKQDLREMGGLRNKMPLTYITFMIAGTALVGLFPLSGFFSKDEVLVSVLHGRGVLWFIPAVLAAGMTAVYVARMLVMAFFGEPRGDAAHHAHESPATMALPMAALAVPAAGLGLLALPWSDAYQGFGTFLFSGEAEPYKLNLLVAAVSVIVAFGAFGWGWSLFRGNGFAVSRVQRRFPHLYAFLENKLYMDALYQWIIDRVVLGFSGLVALFDRKVVNDTGVNGSGQITVLAGRLLRYHETGLLSNYILAMSFSALIIVLIMIIR